jgi:hypothetical protein
MIGRLTTAALALLVGVGAQSAWAQDVRIYVFIKADPSGFVDADSKDRQDTLTDLRKALSKKKGLSVVDDPKAAGVSVEILGRGFEETGGLNVRSPLELGPDLKPNREMTIRSRLLVGDYETPIVAQNSPGALFQSGRWQDLAGKLANQIEKWVKDNRSKLLERPTNSR